jgi:hypothetical protein
VKLPVLALALALWWLLPGAERWAVPFDFAGPWGVAIVPDPSVLLSFA